MSAAHLYIFSDASPSDWLEYGKDERWHTIANFVFQSDPKLQRLIDGGKTHEDVLLLDNHFNSLFLDLQRMGQLRKWKTGPAYKSKFCRTFSEICQDYRPIVSACSFQEKVLRQSKDAILKSYNKLVGGVENRGISFEEFFDQKNRLQMRHSFVNFYGHHEIVCPENKMLVILFLSWFITDQYIFFRREIVESNKYGFDRLDITVVSDKLSSDGKTEELLRNLIDPEGEGIAIKVTQSSKSDSFAGDLLVDNLAGWFNSSIMNEEYTQFAIDLANSGVLDGWHVLKQSCDKLESAHALDYIRGNSC
jgi:hypothetical protein